MRGFTEEMRPRAEKMRCLAAMQARVYGDRCRSNMGQRDGQDAFVKTAQRRPSSTPTMQGSKEQTQQGIVLLNTLPGRSAEGCMPARSALSPFLELRRLLVLLVLQELSGRSAGSNIPSHGAAQLAERRPKLRAAAVGA
jgi:hypothetical protein